MQRIVNESVLGRRLTLTTVWQPPQLLPATGRPPSCRSTRLALRYLTADDFRPLLSLNTTSLDARWDSGLASPWTGTYSLAICCSCIWLDAPLVLFACSDCVCHRSLSRDDATLYEHHVHCIINMITITVYRNRNKYSQLVRLLVTLTHSTHVRQII